MADIVNMADQFSGLPMESLIGGPLQAACKAEVMLAAATTNFIETIGFEDKAEGDTGPRKAKNGRLQLPAPRHRPGGENHRQRDGFAGGAGAQYREHPQPDGAKCGRDLRHGGEIVGFVTAKQRQERHPGRTCQAGLGHLFAGRTIKGSISSHESNTRSSDNSAKYHVAVQARQAGMPEGLSRVLDILTSAVQPKSVTQDQPHQAAAARVLSAVAG